jgi:hypothetical protein
MCLTMRKHKTVHIHLRQRRTRLEGDGASWRACLSCVSCSCFIRNASPVVGGYLGEKGVRLSLVHPLFHTRFDLH